MRLYNTTSGWAREDQPGVLSLLVASEGTGIDSVETLATSAVRSEIPLDQAHLLAPVRRPGKILIIGLNYPSHAEEARAVLAALGKAEADLPTEPTFSIVAGSAVTNPGERIRLPVIAAEQVDYEGELAVVIGRECADVSADEGWSCVAGFTIGNDVSARDIQRRAMHGDPAASIGLAKSLDTFKPLGPCLVTTDEFDGLPDLSIQTRVNGELRQDDRTGTMLHPIPELISHLSRYLTLNPGDVICTGTPKGAGFFSGRFLAPGDEVTVAIERIGTLSNPVGAA